MLLADLDTQICFLEEGFKLIHIPSKIETPVYEHNTRNYALAKQKLQELIQDLADE